MAQLIDKEISKIFKGKAGEKDGRPWQIWDVYFKGDDKTKFTYFQSGKKGPPEVGMKFVLVEYDEEKKGQYTNRTITKLTFKEEEGPKEQSQGKTESGGGGPASMGKDNAFWFVLSYVKDLQVARINRFPDSSVALLKDLVKETFDEAKNLMQYIKDMK
jgi:hypothetical protein